ncbi:MAG: acyl transferase [Terrimonas sp.]|nr:acyl transferase [Terrimonas sp.]
MACECPDKIFSVTEQEFEPLALDIYRCQYQENPLYRLFADSIGKPPQNVGSLAEIPYLPIRFFKSHIVKTGAFEDQVVFKSSGTTAMSRSSHHVKDISLYEKSFLKTFEQFYGSPGQYCIAGLLPSYIEQGSSSLVYMVEHLIRKSGHPASGFYLYDHRALSRLLEQHEQMGTTTILFGVTFALLDFAAAGPLYLKNCIIIETGGMKGRKKEMTREEVHQVLMDAWGVSSIHAEYGMTELLSQAYSTGSGRFRTPPWMKILLRDDEDPFLISTRGEKSGVLNIIDLANVHSCSFIATDDVGKIHADGSFEVLGRMDNADIRGCSLMTV